MLGMEQAGTGQADPGEHHRAEAYTTCYSLEQEGHELPCHRIPFVWAVPSFGTWVPLDHCSHRGHPVQQRKDFGLEAVGNGCSTAGPEKASSVRE
jgi:hypothetical protein